METINIRSIQHYLYCPHRWGLTEIDKAWAENYFVVKGNLLHERVHNPDRNYISKNKKVFSSISVWNDLPEYNLFGVIDCVEAILSNSSTSASYNGEKYDLCIVEYKPTQPTEKDFHKEDAIQVFAQKVCIDYVLGGNCKAVLYYGNTKKRITLPFDTNFEEYNNLLKSTLDEIQYHLKNGIIPKIQKEQYCNGCSMKDICMPKLKKQKNLYNRIKSISEDVL